MTFEGHLKVKQGAGRAFLGKGTRIYRVTEVGSSREKVDDSQQKSVATARYTGEGRSCKVWPRPVGEGFECHAKRFSVYARINRMLREVFKKYVIGVLYYKSNKVMHVLKAFTYSF